jgi:hypothetical protein
MKKFLLLFVAISSFVIGVSFIYANFINFDKKITFFDSSSKNIFPDSKKLNNNILIFKSNVDISNYKVYTKCKHTFKFL